MGFRRRCLGLGTVWSLLWMYLGKAMVGTGHQPLSVTPIGSTWDVSVWVCPLRAHSAQSPTSPRAVSLGAAWDLCPGATRSVLGLREWEVSQPMVHGCYSQSWWQSCLHVCPHCAAGDPDVSLSPGRPSRSHSTMSLSVRPQRRVLVTKINRSQSFAGVNSSADRPFR